MTALIYKAALPTYTSLEDLVANADENLVLNEAGTAYELEPGQSGAYVPGTDRMYVESDYNSTQTLANGVATMTTLTFDTPYFHTGDAFELGTKGIKVLAGTLFAGVFYVSTNVVPVTNFYLALTIRESLTDGGALVGNNLAYTSTLVPANMANYFAVPFWLSGVTLGRWICVRGVAQGADFVVDSFGGMDIRRIA